MGVEARLLTGRHSHITKAEPLEVARAFRKFAYLRAKKLLDTNNYVGRKASSIAGQLAKDMVLVVTKSSADLFDDAISAGAKDRAADMERCKKLYGHNPIQNELKGTTKPDQMKANKTNYYDKIAADTPAQIKV